MVQRIAAEGDIQPTVFAGFYISQLPLHAMKRCRVVGGAPPLPGRANCGIGRFVRATPPNRRLLRSLMPGIYHPTYYKLTPRPSGTRLVITVYDMIHEKFPHYYPRDDPTAALKRVACLTADAIICISESTRRDLLEYYPALEAKTSVVYLAATAGFGVAGAALEEPRDQRPYALFVGGRLGYKGFDVALEAWQLLQRTAPELRLICAGGGNFSAAEFAAIRKRGLGAKISQTAASEGELAALYRQAALVICPSRYEGFGLPVLEAMACGCPGGLLSLQLPARSGRTGSRVLRTRRCS